MLRKLLRRLFFRQRSFKTYGMTRHSDGSIDTSTHHRWRWWWEHREKCGEVEKRRVK